MLNSDFWFKKYFAGVTLCPLKGKTLRTIKSLNTALPVNRSLEKFH